jgi:general stress protein YciG
MAEKKKRKNPAAVELGRRGGLKSRVNLTPEQRRELGRKGAQARWGKPKAGKPKKG